MTYSKAIPFESINFFSEKMMKAPIDFFTEIKGPRIDRCKEHLLEDIQWYC